MQIQPRIVMVFFSWIPEPTKEIIVTATQQTVQGFSANKGKLIFKMDTNLVEPIQHL